MLGYIKGTIAEKSPALIILECQGIGYEINISLNTYDQIKEKESIRLYTYLHIKEDAHTLYGFSGQEEKYLFIQLISVSGVGPSTARMMLSSLSPENIRTAILSNDESTISSIKGIGPKSAKRLILELKDKIGKATTGSASFSQVSHNTNKQEALSALTLLGFKRSAAEKAVDKVLKKSEGQPTVEDLIKEALKNI